MGLGGHSFGPAPADHYPRLSLSRLRLGGFIPPSLQRICLMEIVMLFVVGAFGAAIIAATMFGAGQVKSV